MSLSDLAVWSAIPLLCGMTGSLFGFYEIISVMKKEGVIVDTLEIILHEQFVSTVIGLVGSLGVFMIVMFLKYPSRSAA